MNFDELKAIALKAIENYLETKLNDTETLTDDDGCLKGRIINERWLQLPENISLDDIDYELLDDGGLEASISCETCHRTTTELEGESEENIEENYQECTLTVILDADGEIDDIGLD